MSLRSVIGRVFPMIRGWQWWNFNWGIFRHSRRVQRSRSPTNWTDTLSRSCSVNQQKVGETLEGENSCEFFCSWNLFLRYALVGSDRFYCRKRDFSPSNSCCYIESPKCSPSLGIYSGLTISCFPKFSVSCPAFPLDSFVNTICFSWRAAGISILNADITTDITEPADLSRFVGYFGIMWRHLIVMWLSCASYSTQ